MNNKIVTAIALVAIGFGIGYFTKPTKIETRTVEVVKQQEAKQQDTAKIVYREKIVYKDGTVKEVEKTEDTSSTKESSLKESNKSSENLVKNDVGLNLSALAIADVNNITGQREYGLHVSKRVFSNITVGAMATTDKKVGVSVGFQF